jgi:glycosyltransferase involved in cell wall biosynthesis
LARYACRLFVHSIGPHLIDGLVFAFQADASFSDQEHGSMQAKPRANARRSAEITVSVVLPLYNEDRVLRTLERRVTEAIRACGCRPEIIFVNDGSQDASPAILDELAAAHAHVRVLHLSRNFGHQVALQAGLEHASGDVIIVMDADLQDDPASIPRLLACWQQGYDVVNAIRSGRKEGLLKKFLFFAFYRLLARVSAIPMPVDAGNFGLVDRRVGREIAQLMDRDRYYSGLRSWVGFKQIGIPVERESRYDARPRVSIRGLFRLAKSAIFSFSAVPLMIFYGIGMISTAVFVGVGGFCLYHKFLTGQAIPGWASVMMTASFNGALNAVGIAILGEYVARIYDQVRGRPMYLVARKVNFRDNDEQEESGLPLARTAAA